MPGESRLRENCTGGSEGRAEVAAIPAAASPDPTVMPSGVNDGVSETPPCSDARGATCEAVSGLEHHDGQAW